MALGGRKSTKVTRPSHHMASRVYPPRDLPLLPLPSIPGWGCVWKLVSFFTLPPSPTGQTALLGRQSLCSSTWVLLLVLEPVACQIFQTLLSLFFPSVKWREDACFEEWFSRWEVTYFEPGVQLLELCLVQKYCFIVSNSPNWRLSAVRRHMQIEIHVSFSTKIA